MYLIDKIVAGLTATERYCESKVSCSRTLKSDPGQCMNPVLSIQKVVQTAPTLALNRKPMNKIIWNTFEVEISKCTHTLVLCTQVYK